MERIVLAYSGGLDTSVAVKWLADRYDAEIVAATIDLGQGKELDDVRERMGALDTLRHILEPSDEVAEDYLTTLVETRDGLFYSGLLVESNDEAVRLRSNPLDPNHVETIPREEIESLDESSLSPMPSGLLSTLQPSEVQDLIRYVLHSP